MIGESDMFFALLRGPRFQDEQIACIKLITLNGSRKNFDL